MHAQVRPMIKPALALTHRVANRGRAFTILELLVVLVIISIIASMMLPVYSSYVARMEESRCIANLHNLYVAASGYLQANGSWPQIPVTLIKDDKTLYAKTWVATLQPYGASHSVWICPTIQRTMGISMDALEKDENYRIDFIAAPFNDNPMTPRLAGTHPWFVEKAGVHSRGNLLILANGSTTSLQDLTGVPPNR